MSVLFLPLISFRYTCSIILRNVLWEFLRNYTVPGGELGSGVGKGGGAGGSVRESGGGLGKFGAAQEEGYFYNKQREELKKIKQKLKDNPESEIKQKKDDK